MRHGQVTWPVVTGQPCSSTANMKAVVYKLVDFGRDQGRSRMFPVSCLAGKASTASPRSASRVPFRHGSTPRHGDSAKGCRMGNIEHGKWP